MKFSWAFLPLLLLPAVQSVPATEPRKLKVLTSILPVYSLTASVAGDLAQVENLLAAGADAHDYQFTPRERRLLAAADLVVINGLKMEPWLEQALNRSGLVRRVVDCASGLDAGMLRAVSCLADARPGEAPARGDQAVSPAGTDPNPHIWLDPLLACHMVTNIQLGLVKADPAHAATYRSNALACIARLQNLHAEISRALAPYQGRPIVTYHDAFHYFARRYELRVVGVLEEVPDVDPSPKHLTALRQAIQRNQVAVIFTEAHHSERLARQMGRDLHLAVAALDPLESGPAQANAYEVGMRRNLRVLQQYLK